MPEPRAKTVYLIDGHALVYRAFYAMISRPLRTSRGENTSAPWGITQFIRKILAERRPDYIGFVFDAGGDETFRHEIYEDYKATREKLDETLQQDFDTAMRRIRQILEAFHIPTIQLAGFEADDVIGTLASQVAEQGLQAVIVSGDKDFYQLIGEKVALLNPGRGGPAAVEEELVDETNAAERLGVPPERVTDYLALVGDSSDNVPGVRGVGPKTAVQLIAQFGALEDILAGVDEVAQKRAREALKRHADDARLSKDLVTIRTKVPMALELDELRAGEPDRDRLRELFLELEFHSLAREYAAGESPAPRVEPVHGYEMVADFGRLAGIAAEAHRAGRVGLDVRSASGGSAAGKLVGLAIAMSEGQAYYLPFGHVATSRPGELELGDVHEASTENLPPLASEELRPIAELLEGETTRLTGHDLKRCKLILGGAGIELRGAMRDVMIASYCLDPGRRQHDLETLVLEEMDRKITSYTDLCGKGRAEIPFPELESARAAGFSGERADMALQIDGRLTRQLNDFGLRKLFEEVEMPLMPVLADMERAGVAIEVEFFDVMSERLDRELKLVEEEIYKLAGRELNINSPVQLREVLFEQLKLPVKKRTKGGVSRGRAPVTAADHRIPRAGEAEVDIRGCAPRARRPADESHPHNVQPDGDLDRPLIQLRPEPAEHPDPHSAGRRDPQGLRPCRGPRVPGSRLLSGRAAYPGASVGGSRVRGSLSGGTRCSPGHGGAHLRCWAGRGDAGDARDGEDGELRDDLRPGAVRAGATAGDKHRRGPRVHRQLLRAIPGDPRVSRPSGRDGLRTGLRGDAVRTPPVYPRAQLEEPRPPTLSSWR
jgi:DNA polymerase-1